MRIAYGKKHVDLNWLPVLVFTGVVLLDEDLLEIVLKGPPDPYAAPEEGIGKYLAGVAIMLSWLGYNKLSPWLKNYFWVMHGVFFMLVLESLFKYGKPMVYPHVFGKLFAPYYVFMSYSLFRNASHEAARWIIYLITIFFFYDLFVHFPTVLSFASFIDVERGFSSYSTFFIVLPLFFFFNRYLAERKIFFLLLFFAFCGLVLFLNHRSVWLSTAFGMMLNTLYLFYKGKEPVPLPAVTPIVVIPIVAVILLAGFVFSENPELVKSIQERVEDISKADEQGTGKWRLQQFQSYMPFILDRPLLGNRFEGYELPNQFIHEGSGSAIFQDATGHHFHSFYVDALFYGGVLLLVLLLAPPLHLAWRAAKAPFRVKAETLAFVAFCIAGILFGTSYLLKYYYFAVVGLSLAVLDNNADGQALEDWQDAQDTAAQTKEEDTAPAEPQPPARPRGRPRPLPA